jgi:hypothetical protein
MIDFGASKRLNKDKKMGDKHGTVIKYFKEI